MNDESDYARSEADHCVLTALAVFGLLLVYLVWEKLCQTMSKAFARPSYDQMLAANFQYEPFDHKQYFYCWKCLRFFDGDQPVHPDLKCGNLITDRMCRGCRPQLEKRT